MSLNLERAILMMARVEIANLQNRWDQRTWGETLGGIAGDLIVNEDGSVIGHGTCGTAMCAAGWALFDSPTRLRWTPSGLSASHFRAERTEDGRLVMEAACQWLGIPMPEGVEELDERWDYEGGMPLLFNASNDLDSLYELLAEWWEEGPEIVRGQPYTPTEYLRREARTKAVLLQAEAVSR